MMKALEGKERLVVNKYEVKKKNFVITISKTIHRPDMLSRKCSNMEEFFGVIDW